MARKKGTRNTQIKHTQRQKRSEQLLVLTIVLLVFLCVLSATRILPTQAAHVYDLPLSSRTALLLPSSSITSSLDQSSEARASLLEKYVSIVFTSDDDRILPPWTVTVRDHPQWIKTKEGFLGSSVQLDEALMIADIRSSIEKLIVRPSYCTINNVTTDAMEVKRAETDCIAKPGQTYDDISFIRDIHRSLQSPYPRAVSVQFVTVSGSLFNASSEDFGSLTLLGSGRSNFQGSGIGRKANVRLALSGHVNNVVVPAGGTFSFNKTLGPSMSTRFGWQMALGIFGGTRLEPTLGGGVCQASSTTYRGVLAAGLPILERKSHSLFVHYYEEYGIGQDATVYFGSQDFTFQNDTGKPLLVQAYTEGNEAYVNIYGTNDGRIVTMNGPYFSKNAPADLQVNGHPLRSNQIAWIRHIRYNDGTMKEDLFVSQYQSIPRKSVQKAIAELTAKQEVAVASNTNIAEQ